MTTRRQAAATRSFLCLIVTALLVLGASHNARAAPIFYDFTLTGTTGSIIGLVGSGSFSVEDSLFTGTGSETFRPVGASTDIQGLLSFDISFPGFVFSISDADSFPESPKVIFVNGLFDDFVFTNGLDPFSPPVFGLNGVGFGIAELDAGTVSTPTLRAAAAIPESGTLTLFAVGLAALGFLYWRRRSHARSSQGWAQLSGSIT